MEYLYMKLLSAVAKNINTATVDNPVVGDVIDIILNDANKLTFEGTNPQVALVNANFIPFIPGNGDFVVNEGNNTFDYGTLQPVTTTCTIANGSYTRNDFASALAKAINIQGSSVNAQQWGNGLDVRGQVIDNILNVITTSVSYSRPYFDDMNYWFRSAAPPVTLIGQDSISCQNPDQPAILVQELAASKVPMCRAKYSGQVTILPANIDTANIDINISKGDDIAYIRVGVTEGYWFFKVGAVIIPDAVQYLLNDVFTLTIQGLFVQLIINQGLPNEMEVGVVEIPDLDWLDTDTIKEMSVSVKQCGVYQFKSTLCPVPNTDQYINMTNLSTSYISWGSQALEVMVGAGSQTNTGTNARPSVITCSTPLVGNNSIGNVLVCLDMECGGHLSGPKTQAVRKFIHTIPLPTSNLIPCTVVAPFLLPIDLDLKGYTSISRIAVRFVNQIDDRVIGFTVPATITLAFLE